MRSTIKFIGMTAATALITLAFTAMSLTEYNDYNDNGDTNYLSTLNLSTAAPSAEVLAAAGIALEEFNQIRDAAGEFQGWTILEEDEYFAFQTLVMAWTGRSLSNFNAVADILYDLFGERGEYCGSTHMVWGNNYELHFFPSRFSEDGFYVNAGTMLLDFFFFLTEYSDDNGAINILVWYKLSTAAPSAEVLAAAGITAAQFNQIRDAAGEFQGWTILVEEYEYYEYEFFIMAWTGRSLSHFTTVADLLDDLFYEEGREYLGMHEAWGNNYELHFFPSRFSEDGYYVNAETMLLFLW